MKRAIIIVSKEITGQNLARVRDFSMCNNEKKAQTTINHTLLQGYVREIFSFLISGLFIGNCSFLQD